MPDTHYENARLAAIYDLDSPWGEDRDFYLALAGIAPLTVLDLGCGTGLLTEAYAARGHIVTGVDPAPAMLDVARQRHHGSEIDWIDAGAEDFRTDRRFDLAVMTGHAFQVLLEEDEVRALLRNVHHHLKPGGRFVFESRNPAIDWSVRWNYDQAFDVDGAEIRQETRCREPMERERIRFEHCYHFADETIVSKSELRFMDRERITRLLEQAGFEVAPLQGDWTGAPFDPAASLEMIFVASRV